MIYQGRKARLNAIVDIHATKTPKKEIHEKKRQTDTRVNNMPQGLVLFDSSERIVVCNRRYVEMYGLSPDVVRAGCSFRSLIEHRKETVSFTGDVEEYRAVLLRDLAKGEPTELIADTADGRSV